ncbi:MAG: hypothetical protein HC880_12055 [Bacteroidia bacterium]|nr:hypothetical protein [Bacteroidia bacterium]
MARKIGDYLAKGLKFNEALKKAKDINAEDIQEGDPPKDHLEQLKDLKLRIMNCVNKAIKDGDPQPLQAAKEYLEELEKVSTPKSKYSNQSSGTLINCPLSCISSISAIFAS